MGSQDYYALLGVPKGNADEEAIKKAYRKLAMRWHPDKNPDIKDTATKKFQDISEAYYVLSDPRRKQIYDLYGDVRCKNSPPDPNTSSTSSHYFGFPRGSFGMNNGFSFQSTGGTTGGYHQFSSHDADDIFSKMFRNDMGCNLDFNDFMKSSTSGTNYKRQHVDESTKDPQRKRVNSDFTFDLGRQYYSDSYQKHKPKNTEMKYFLLCTLAELYSGTQKKLKITRTVEDLKTGISTPEAKVLQVDVQAGWKEGTKIRFAGQGDVRVGQAPQDIVIIIKEKPDGIFKRDGDNLKCTTSLSLREALNGFTGNIPTVNGGTVNISLNATVQPGSQHIIYGYGMPRKSGGQGDLIVKFDVRLPTDLNALQIDAITAVLN